MALFISLFILFMFPLRNNADYPPDPGYNPSSKIDSTAFKSTLKNLWGSHHQKLDEDGNVVTLILDDTTGSGFKSRFSYLSGYFGSRMKLPNNSYTAGVDISLYLSNGEKRKLHDEVDIEFLGHIDGQPYVLQTNVFINGSGDGDKAIGREIQTHLWFDPTTDFHTYAILWSPLEIIFLVDDVPIRQYKKLNDNVFPTRAMWAYGSIWDASKWATDNGRYKTDYSFQPFIAEYKDFKVKGCHRRRRNTCSSPSVSPSGDPGLSPQQYAAMTWVQSHFTVYDYCKDQYRDHSLTPECAS